ncbi:MAG: T9SS type A sorting domain-containing protein [Bacteroidetes bacterium]|nr:T9SS type A sorting domain-containing protein [Bacteroidota bacterium]
MIKKLLASSLSVFSFLFSFSQDLRIIYNLAGCPNNPLVGQSPIYIFPSVATSGPAGQNEYFGGIGATPPTQLTMVNSGVGIWEICLDPYTFTDATGLTPSASATIFNIRMQFHNQSLSVLTGDCTGSQMQIDNPMTSTPTSSHPGIVNSLRNCFVSVNTIEEKIASVYLSPNPAKTNTTFYLNLPRGGNVEIEIFNMLGKKIKAIVAKNQSAGDHKINFDLEDNSGNQLKNGYYFYTFKLNNESIKTGKIAITR